MILRKLAAVSGIVIVAACGPRASGGPDDSGTPPLTDGGRPVEPPKISTTSLADAHVGRPYTQKLAAQGGTRPLSWAIVNASPELAWLSIDALSGELAGTPGIASPQGGSVTVRVTDSAAEWDEKAFTLVVRECSDGESLPCSAADGGVCLLGTRTCERGTLGACVAATPSTDAAKCGPSCGSCGTTANACAGGECRCGNAAPCSGATPTCCGGPDGGQCVDLQQNVDFCGSCANRCDADRKNVVRTCAGGTCSYPCATGWARCPVGSTERDCSTNLLQDVNNCGGCGSICPQSAANSSGSTCQNGACRLTCNAGWGDCNNSVGDGCETPITSSTSHCGACGRACPASTGGSATCANGLCGMTCPPGFNLCGTTCISNNDFNHCGGCNRACPSSVPNASSVTCVNGTCRAVCISGYGDCNGQISDGCETNLLTDLLHCGACTRACDRNNYEACVFGVCCTRCTSTRYDCCERSVCNSVLDPPRCVTPP